MTSMSDEKSELINKSQESSNSKPEVSRAWNRMISEGYKYRVYQDSLSSSSEELTQRDSLKKKTNKKWNKHPCRLTIVMAIAVVVIATLAGVIIWQYMTKNQKTCTTLDCVQTSAYISSKMDQNADPCENFYQFTCGNWEKNTKIPASRKKYSIFTEISDKNEDIIRPLIEENVYTYKGIHSKSIKKAKDFYNICLDEEKVEKLGSEPLLDLIKELGSWSLTPGLSWSSSSWNFLDALIMNHKYAQDALFSMGVTVDNKNSSAYIIEFEQSGLTLQSREEYFKNNSRYEDYKKGFMGFATKVGVYLGGDHSTVEAAMEKVYKFEQKLAEIHMPKEELIDPDKTYHKMTVSEFQKMIGNFISVKDYLTMMFKQEIRENTEVLVPTKAYFYKLNAIVNSTEKSTLANYIVWNMISSVTGYMPSKYIDAALMLDKEENGVTKLDPRWRRCLNKVNSMFGFVTSTLYVKDYFPDSSRHKVSTIVEEVRKAFIADMPTVGWMDKETRDKAIDKANFIVKMIGYPDWITLVSKLDEYYKNVTITEDQFFKSHLSILRFEEERNINKLGTVPDRTEWHMKPHETNAYYSPSFNGIVLPAGILQRPFFSPKFPMSFNFGTTGMIVGHEMTHGFDNTGRHFDKYGNLHNWWTNQSGQSFSSHSGCMVKQYSSYTAEGIHLKGERVLGENIADNGGLKSAYAAFQHWVQNHGADHEKKLPGLDYTQEQLFFIGFGQLWCAKYTKEYTKTAILTDEHTYSKYRTIGVVSNSGDFARAFNCKPNSPMNPQTKCQVW